MNLMAEIRLAINENRFGKGEGKMDNEVVCAENIKFVIRPNFLGLLVF